GEVGDALADGIELDHGGRQLENGRRFYQLSQRGTLPLSSWSCGLNGMSGGGRATAGCSLRLGLTMPQPPPSCSSDTTQLSFLPLLPGIGIATDLTPLRTHSASSDS